MSKGLLIVAANCIGNDADVPQRTLDALRIGDLLIFEEDRPARKLLKAAGIHKEYLKHNEHNDKLTKQDLKSALEAGKTVVYASDQGTAGLADPGRELVEIAYAIGAKVKVIPGPSSITAAICACPFDCSSFDYVGFLPREEDKRVKSLKQLKSKSQPQIILDAPYRLLSLLKSSSSALGSKAIAFLALDISGPDESYLYGSFENLIKKVEALDQKLNFVLIISASS